MVLVFNFRNRINMVTLRFLAKTAPNRTMLMPSVKDEISYNIKKSQEPQINSKQLQKYV